MVSKSGELLAGDDIERILTVIDNGILAEPNELETEFAATVSKIWDINSESCFYAKIAEKYIKQKEVISQLNMEITRIPTKRDCL